MVELKQNEIYRMDVFEINTVLSKSKLEVAAVIKAKCIHSEQQHLKLLLDHLLSPSNNSIDDEEVLEWLSWLVAGGSTPEEFSSTVRLYDKATTCGLVWSENFVAYRCRTCGISPCMSLCTDCFHHGNHDGHDFIIFRSETGGGELCFFCISTYVHAYKCKVVGECRAII